MKREPALLRRIARRVISRRLVGVCALAAVLLAAPSAAGVLTDDTAPVVLPLYFGPVGANGWYTGDVTLNWSISDPDGPILDWDHVNCAPTKLLGDVAEVTRTCWAESAGGRQSVTTKKIRIDKTPPVVTATASRAADANGWYNHALTVVFSGTDGTSGLESCAGGSYSGPDNPAAVVAGSCRDVAGNVAPSAFSFKYDSTPPSVTAVGIKRGNRMAQFSWRASADTKRVEIARAPGRKGAGQTVVYSGPASSFRDSGLTAGRNYRYRITGFDEAQNRVDQTLTFTASGRLLTPAPGEKVKLGQKTILTWTRANRATYYNLQLIRGGKVLSAWPVRASFQLPRSWVYQGRHYRLRPGVYRWYVWPGIGRISANRYGRLLGSSSFVVTS